MKKELEQDIAIVLRHHNTTLEQIQARDRTPGKVQIRADLIRVCAKHGMRVSHIARLVMRDHTTVMHALERMSEGAPATQEPPKEKVRWTDRAVQRLCAMARKGVPHREIAAVFGCTESAVTVKLYKLNKKGVISISGRGRNARGGCQTIEGKIRIGQAARERWTDESFRDRQLPAMRERAKAESRRAKLRLSGDRRRGYTIPDHQREEYEYLVNILKVPSREAARILKLPAFKEPAHERVTAVAVTPAVKSQIGGVIAIDKPIIALWRKGLSREEIARSMCIRVETVERRLSVIIKEAA